MNKQNKLVLKAVKSALRVVEAVEKAEESKLDNRFGTSRRPRFCPGGTHSPNTDNSPEPPMGKILFHRGNGCPELQGCEALGPFTSRVLNAQLEEIKRLKNPLKDFAGDDTPYVEKLLERAIDDPKAFSQPYAYFEKTGARIVHLKSPELGTETLVVLSPEGETLLKIVKDNSRKFEVK